jgi:hypothetical protein
MDSGPTSTCCRHRAVFRADLPQPTPTPRYGDRAPERTGTHLPSLGLNLVITDNVVTLIRLEALGDTYLQEVINMDPKNVPLPLTDSELRIIVRIGYAPFSTQPRSSRIADLPEAPPEPAASRRKPFCRKCRKDSSRTRRRIAIRS